jgi:hypothetical protein
MRKTLGVVKDVLPLVGNLPHGLDKLKLPRQQDRESAVGDVLAAVMCADANSARVGEGRVEEESDAPPFTGMDLLSGFSTPERLR